MRKHIKLFLLGVMAIAIAGQGWGQPPMNINLQGKVSGVTLSGPGDITYSFDGINYFTVTSQGYSYDPATGIFNAVLVPPNPTNFSARSVYFAIQGGTPIQQALNAVPYALLAVKADYLAEENKEWLKSGNNIYNNSLNTNVGIGISEPLTKLHVYKPEAIGSAADKNWIATIGEPIGEFATGGLVGIRIGGWPGEYAGVPTSNRAVGVAAVAEEGWGNRVGMALYTGGATAGQFSEKVRITNAGNVGIGTNNPGTLLDVNGSFTLGHNTGGQAYCINFLRSGGKANFPDIYGNETNALIIAGKSTGGGDVGFNANVGINGNVGIIGSTIINIGDNALWGAGLTLQGCMRTGADGQTETGDLPFYIKNTKTTDGGATWGLNSTSNASGFKGGKLAIGAVTGSGAIAVPMIIDSANTLSNSATQVNAIGGLVNMSNVNISGRLQLAVRYETASVVSLSQLPTDTVILAVPTSNVISFILPKASLYKGRVIIIKQVTQVYQIAFTAQAGDGFYLDDGIFRSAQYLVPKGNKSFQFISDGVSYWHQIN